MSSFMQAIAELNDRAPPPRPERVAFSIPEFCWRNTLSVRTYHKLKRLGLGPDEIRIGNIVRITAESELNWQRRLSNPKGAEAEARARTEAKARARGSKAGKISAASRRHVNKRKRGRS